MQIETAEQLLLSKQNEENDLLLQVLSLSLTIEGKDSVNPHE